MVCCGLAFLVQQMEAQWANGIVCFLALTEMCSTIFAILNHGEWGLHKGT